MRMNPAWLMDEYASMRFTLVCTTAEMEPMTNVRIAMIHTTGRQSSFQAGNATTSTRSMAANAAILPMLAINAVIGVGEPW